MGDYASDQYRREVKARFGFDPGPLYDYTDDLKVKKLPLKTNCKLCGKSVKTLGLSDHQRDAHGVKKQDV